MVGEAVRREDAVGVLLDFWTPDELRELAEIEANLPADGRAPGEVVPVKLRAAVTEADTLKLHAIPRNGGEGCEEGFEVRADGQ
ncbi:hypothetical protein [Rhodoferax sp. U11-2br]|uniref:hypothetical protein n=1 Tax=Rhodoferax sp. U11-2br TaxID=2838878 RepID=UPI001BE59EB7|nr:hypothetical protein [Rhodoferax sp. U11-2br]